MESLCCFPQLFKIRLPNKSVYQPTYQSFPAEEDTSYLTTDDIKTLMRDLALQISADELRFNLSTASQFNKNRIEKRVRKNKDRLNHLSQQLSSA